MSAPAAGAKGVRRVVSVRPVADKPMALRLRYADGGEVEADFAAVAARGGVFARLRDPAYFSRVRIGDGGRAVLWPDDLDFCVDALWLDAQPQRHAG